MATSVPYLFVVGCPRSGTTLIQRMLDAHPQLTVACDTLFIPKGPRRLKPGKNPKLTPHIVESTRNLERFHRLGLPDEAVDRAASVSRTYAEFVSALYRELGELHGKPLAGEKSPGYVKHIPLLHSLFPSAKFIHIIRDGRDVALSLLDWGLKNRGPARNYELWKDEPIAVCALSWSEYVESGRRDGADLSPSLYRELSYEDLVAHPEQQLRALCEFLELPYSDSMLRYHEGKMRLKPGKSAKAAWLPPTPGLRDWRLSMSDRDKELFEALAGDLLGELGYERCAFVTSPEINRIAVQCQASWTQRGRSTNERAVSHRAPFVAHGSAQTRVGGPNGNAKLERRTGPGSRERSVNPYLFVGGCPRSGTTLLQRMLNNHPQLCVANDSHFVPTAIKGLRLGVNPVLTQEIVARVRNSPRFGRLGLPDSAVGRAASRAGTYAEFVSALFSELAGLHGKSLAGEKAPRYMRYLPLLHELFPSTKFVHIIRDGRDVALSLLEWANESKGPGKFGLWQEEPVAVCALWWAWLVTTGRRDGGKLGPSHYFEVQYEHLVSQPDRELQQLSNFLELPYAPDMLAYHEGRMNTNPKRSAKSAWLPPTPGLRDWRSGMRDRDVDLFEALAGDLLSQLGYERRTAATSPAIVEVAEKCRSWWGNEKSRTRSRSRGEGSPN